LLKRKVQTRLAQIYVILVASLILFLMMEKSLPKYPEWSRLLIISIFYILDLSILILFVRFLDHGSLKELGFTSKNVKTALLSGFTASAGLILLVPFFGIPPAFLGGEFLVLVFATFLIGLTEEVYFRGYIQGKLKQIQSKTSAIVSTAILFAFAHVPSYIVSYEGLFFILITIEAIRSITIIGILFGFLYDTVENLWCVIIAHMTWDLYLLEFPPTFLSTNPLAMLTFILMSTFLTYGTLGFSMAIAFHTVKVPFVVQSGKPPPKPPRTCPYCKSILGKNFAYCPKCGRKMEDIYEGAKP
jgi:membrane protease YdiL (CAAX protease family)